MGDPRVHEEEKEVPVAFIARKEGGKKRKSFFRGCGGSVGPLLPRGEREGKGEESVWVRALGAQEAREKGRGGGKGRVLRAAKKRESTINLLIGWKTGWKLTKAY